MGVVAAGASKTNGKAAQIAATRKRTQFATIDELLEGAHGIDFVSNALETGRRFGADALRLLSELGVVAAASNCCNSCQSKPAFVLRALAELACFSCRGNAGVYAGSIWMIHRHACLACCGGAGSVVQVGEIVALDG